ncbi:hypothetical protein FCIRC_10362 [Fusarium circinatum]|uniref:Uncharacterized protein n=1 Tax=Fusarium circinatum TaxID=48490 RepID=A0A8H5TC70_FUSCI|nr:hypothetical protein FCIRC_10362 [Fusarium circinatum]
MSEGPPLKPLQPARPVSQVHLSPGSAEEAIASLRAFGTSFPQVAGTRTAQTSTTPPLPTVPVTEQSQQPQTGATPAKKPRRRQPKKAQAQASTSQLSIPQGSQQVQQPQAEAPPSQKAKQPRKSRKRTIDSVSPSASQEGRATKKPALQVSQPTQPHIQAPPSAVAQASQPTQLEIEASSSAVALQAYQPTQSEIQAPPPTAAQLSHPTQPEIEASPCTVALQASQSPQSGTQAPPSTIDLPPHQPAQQLQFQAPRTDPIPGAWWEIDGFSEAFKQYHRNQYGKEGTLKPIVVQGIINLVVVEYNRIQAARQAAESQGAANPTAPEQETDPVSASVLGLVNLSGGSSSKMGTDNQQTAIDLPIDPQLLAEYDSSSMDPRTHTIHIGGVKLSQVGLGPDPALPKDEVDGRFEMIEDELKNQNHLDNIPIPKASELAKQPPKEFVGSTYLMPSGVKDARLQEVLNKRNNIILNKQKKVDLSRNNLAAKGTRERREEKERNYKSIIANLQTQMNWWHLKAISLGANAGEWNAISEENKNTMLKDMEEKVCQAEKAQSMRIREDKGLEHSNRNSTNARLSKQDAAKKEKEVQAIIAAIEVKDRERQEAQSEGQKLPEMDLKEFINMTFPDDVIHVDTTTAAGVTTGDTAEAPTSLNYNQNDSIQANTSGPININGVPVEPTANIGESADAGGTIEHLNTTDVNNTMDVGNPINNNNSSMDPNDTMDGNALTMDEDALNTDNMVSGHAINNSSLPPNDWAYQAYAQTDNALNMSIDFQGAPLNNYGMQENNMQDNNMLNNGMQNWVPGGTVMGDAFHGDAMGNFDPQSNDFLSLEPQENGFIQSNPQDILFDTDDMQDININANGFQRITALDDCTQGNTSLDYPMIDNTPLDTSLYGNASLGNSTQCSTSLDYSVQGDVNFDTSFLSNASIDSGTQNDASFDINFQDNASVNYGPQGSLPTHNGIYDATPYNNLIQDNASSSTNPQGNGNATIKQKPNRVTKATKPSRASKSNGRNVKKPETVRRELTAADLPRVANPTPHNAFNPAVLARARLDHIDHADPYAFGGRPPSASHQIITPRARDFANDKYLTFENSFTAEGNQNLFTAHYENLPSDD